LENLAKISLSSAFEFDCYGISLNFVLGKANFSFSRLAVIREEHPALMSGPAPKLPFNWLRMRFCAIGTMNFEWALTAILSAYIGKRNFLCECLNPHYLFMNVSFDL